MATRLALRALFAFATVTAKLPPFVLFSSTSMIRRPARSNIH